MPICALTAQALMVMPDWSLVVTTFSRQSWLLQRTATRVMSMVTFADKEYPVRSTNAGFMPPWCTPCSLGRPMDEMTCKNTRALNCRALARDGQWQRKEIHAAVTIESGGDDS